MTRLTHGHAARSVRGGPTAEYRIWCNMRRRCSATLKDYGARGIRVCTRWDSFAKFLADMGPRPSPQHSLDRKDVNGHYTPLNCRWATRIEQARNTRANRNLTFQGETHTVVAWAEKLGISANTIRVRLLRGKSVARALSTNKHTRSA